MLRRLLYFALALGVAADLSDIAQIDFTFKVLGMSIDNYGSDFVKTFSLSRSTPSFQLGMMPHGTTTIDAKAYNSTSHQIYQSAPYSENFDAQSATAVLTLLPMGYANVTSTHNICPILLSWSISPMNLRPGRNTTVAYRTFDPDGSQDADKEVEVKLEMPSGIEGTYGVLDTLKDVTVEAGDKRYGSDSVVINLLSTELNASASPPLVPRDTDIVLTAEDHGGCEVADNISTKIIPSVSDTLDYSIKYGISLASVTADGTTTAAWTATDANDDVTAKLVFTGECDGGQTIKTSIECQLTGTTADSTTHTATVADVTCSTGSGTSGNPLEIELPFVTGTSSGAMCTATFVVDNHGSELVQENTFQYLSGNYATTSTHAPEIDFAFVSRRNIQTGSVVSILVDFRGYGNLNQPTFTCSGQGFSVSSSFPAFSILTANTARRAVTEFTVTNATKLFLPGDNKCTASVQNVGNALTVSKEFKLNEAPFVYISPSPTPATCLAPADTCLTFNLTETSQSKHIYPSQGIDYHDLPPGSVIALHTRESNIFASNLDVDVAHAIANCGEIEARVTTGSVDSNGNVYHIEIEKFYYNGDWHNGTSLVVDATGLSQTKFRVVSRPLVSTNFVLELRDCDTGNVQVRELVLEHYMYNLSMPDSSCEDDVVYGLVNMTGTCHVGFTAHNSDPCDSVAAIALPCGTVCQEYSGTYVQANSSGFVAVYNDSGCTTALATLAPTGNLDTRAATNGVLPDFDEYTSELFS